MTDRETYSESFKRQLEAGIQGHLDLKGNPTVQRKRGHRDCHCFSRLEKLKTLTSSCSLRDQQPNCKQVKDTYFQIPYLGRMVL